MISDDPFARAIEQYVSKNADGRTREYWINTNEWKRLSFIGEAEQPRADIRLPRGESVIHLFGLPVIPRDDVPAGELALVGEDRKKPFMRVGLHPVNN